MCAVVSEVCLPSGFVCWDKTCIPLFQGAVCAPCPVAQDLGVVPDCNSLPVCLLTLSERSVLFCLHFGTNFKDYCCDRVHASSSSVCK